MRQYKKCGIYLPALDAGVVGVAPVCGQTRHQCGREYGHDDDARRDPQQSKDPPGDGPRCLVPISVIRTEAVFAMKTIRPTCNVKGAG